MLTKTEQRLAHTCGLGLRTKKVKNEKGTHRQQTKQTQGLMGRAVHKGQGPISKSAKTQVKVLSHRKTWSLAYKEQVPRSVCSKNEGSSWLGISTSFPMIMWDTWCMHTCVEARGPYRVSFSITFYFKFGDRVSLNLELLDLSRLPDSKHGTACLFLPITLCWGYRGTPASLALTWLGRSAHGSSC